MHQYLRAIGFKSIFSKEAEIERMLDNLFQSFDSRVAVREETPGCAFLDMYKSFGPGIGIHLCGQMDSEGFHRTFYFPCFEGGRAFVSDQVEISVKSDGNGYYALVEDFDDSPGDAAVIFSVENPGEVMRSSFRGILSSAKVSVSLTGLSDGGVILLGTHSMKARKKQTALAAKRQSAGFNEAPEKTKTVDSPVAAQPGGEEMAMWQEAEVSGDIELYSMLMRRVNEEDVLSIVESSFVPGGMECDQYRVLGEILFYTKIQNALTRQYLYQMTLECNGIIIEVCINSQDLTGDPEVGRRFRGNIWLQGKLAWE